MVFLSLCPVYEYEYYYDPVVGASDLLGLFAAAAFLAIQLGIFIYWCNNCVTKPPVRQPEMVVLALDDPPIYFQEAGPSTWMVALYLLTGLVTFSLGVLAFEIVHSFS